MLTSDPHATLLLVHERVCRLRDEAAAERLVRPRTRRAFAACLRCVANRLDPAMAAR
ncbi:MAG TPA: hypothetical protein VFU26_05410 [Gaiellaceae bacterium]|nr:hypothetical protein [Gaiellaceae bacterium]